MTSTELSLFSQDQISNKHNTGYFVTDLDDSMGSGTHWVVMNIIRDIIEYNSTPYQDLLSVLCGYYCLHCMNECSRRAMEICIMKKAIISYSHMLSCFANLMNNKQ